MYLKIHKTLYPARLMSIHINEAISPVVIKAVQGDITDIETDVMVNSVNTAMVLGGTRSVASRINELTEGRLESCKTK